VLPNSPPPDAGVVEPKLGVPKAPAAGVLPKRPPVI